MRAICAAIVVVMTGCAGTGERSEDAPETALEADVAAPVVHDEELGPHQSPLRTVTNPRDYVSHNYNLQIPTEDPGKALAKARDIAIELRARIDHASSSDVNASLNLRVPPSQGHAVFRALIEAFPEIESENISRNDMSQHVRQLDRRFEALTIAEVELRRVVRSAENQKIADALLVQLELNRNERENIRNQLVSTEQQLEADQIYVNFNLRAEDVPEDQIIEQQIDGVARPRMGK